MPLPMPVPVINTRLSYNRGLARLLDRDHTHGRKRQPYNRNNDCDPACIRTVILVPHTDLSGYDQYL